MSEEPINPTPKQTEFIITLPDKESQYDKCVAIRRKTIIVKTTVTKTDLADDDTLVDTVENEPDRTEEAFVPYTEGTGQEIKMITWKQLYKKVEDKALNTDALDASTAISKFQKLSNKLTGNTTTKDTLAKVLKEIISFYAPEIDTSQNINKNLDDFKDFCKSQAKWGLGCPGNCGYFWEFTYKEIVPQTIICPQCNVNITLI
jgi:hypothetical protein